MAKDGTNRGGARVGAGAKKKPLADKIAEGNPGGRKLTVMEFTDTADLNGQVMPEPAKMLEAVQKDGKTLVASEIYKSLFTSTGKRLFRKSSSSFIEKPLRLRCCVLFSRAISGAMEYGSSTAITMVGG